MATGMLSNRRAMTPEEERAVAGARGRAVDRLGNLRNKLVRVVQEHPDENVRAQARQRLADLPKFDPTADERGMRDDDQSDPSPSGPLVGGLGLAKPEEKPGLLRRMDTSIGMMVLNPAKRRQALSEFDKTYSAGIFGKIGRGAAALADKVLPEGAKRYIDTQDMTPERMAQYERESPLSPAERAAAGVAGALAPGSLPRLLGGGAERALMSVPGAARAAAAAPRLTGAAVGAGSASLSSGGHAGAQALVEGAGVKEAGRRAKEAATDPVTVGLGALFGGAFGHGARRRAQNRDVELLESRGAQVGPTTPGRGGALDDPLVSQGIDDATGRVTEEGIGRVGRQSARGVRQSLEAREAGVSERFRGAERAARESGELAEQVDVSDVYEAALQMAKNPELPRAVRGQIKGEIVDDFINTFGELDDAGRVMMSADKANALKKKLQYFAEFTPSGKPDPYFAPLSGRAKEVVDETPYGRINEEFARGAGELEEARGAFGLPRKFGKPITPEQESSMATRIMRRGQDTRYAGRDITPEMGDVLKRYPELQRFVEAPELLQARGNLEFGLAGGKVGGLYEKLKDVIGRNITPAEVRIIAPLFMGVGRQAPTVGPFMRALGEGARAEEGRERR